MWYEAEEAEVIHAVVTSCNKTAILTVIHHEYFSTLKKSGITNIRYSVQIINHNILLILVY